MPGDTHHTRNRSLRFGSDEEPGIRRKGTQRFTYVNEGQLRRRVDRDLRRDEMSHDRVVALVVRLLDVTSLRIGNAEYARSNKSFGLTTLRNRHAVVRGSTIHFGFRGKSAHDFDVTIDNRRLAKIVRSCQHLPGQQLFEYRALDESVRRVDSADVNEYLGAYARPGATAKTFRTWNATVRAAEALFIATQHEETPSKVVLNAAIDQVADHLGNTRPFAETVTCILQSSMLTSMARCSLAGDDRSANEAMACRSSRRRPFDC